MKAHPQFLFCRMNSYQPPLVQLFRRLPTINHCTDDHENDLFFISERDLFIAFDIHYCLLEARLIEYYSIDIDELKKEVNELNVLFQCALFKNDLRSDKPYLDFLMKRLNLEMPDSRCLSSKSLDVIVKALELFPKYKVLTINAETISRCPYIQHDEDFFLNDENMSFLRKNELTRKEDNNNLFQK